MDEKSFRKRFAIVVLLEVLVMALIVFLLIITHPGNRFIINLILIILVAVVTVVVTVRSYKKHKP